MTKITVNRYNEEDIICQGCIEIELEIRLGPREGLDSDYICGSILASFNLSANCFFQIPRI